MSNTTKPILVVSHERSGTHFLLNSIASNFNKDFLPKNVPSKDHNYFTLGGDNEEYKLVIKMFLEMAANSSDGSGKRLFKSHHDVALYDKALEALQGYNVVYVHRSCKDVLTSLWHYFRAHQGVGSDFPFPQTLRQLALGMKPSDYRFDTHYSGVSSNNFVERWKYHHEGWMNSDIPIATVSYEDLSQSFEPTISGVAESLGLTAPNVWYKPSLGEFVSVYPRNGNVGEWETLFEGEEDLIAEIDAILNDESNNRSS